MNCMRAEDQTQKQIIVSSPRPPPFFLNHKRELTFPKLVYINKVAQRRYLKLKLHEGDSLEQQQWQAKISFTTITDGFFFYNVTHPSKFI
jgi:hypothetical protein